MASDQDTIFNLGSHFKIIKGSALDSDKYYSDGWYLDATSYKNTMNGTLYYYRSFRTDGRDYASTYVTKAGRTSG